MTDKPYGSAAKTIPALPEGRPPPTPGQSSFTSNITKAFSEGISAIFPAMGSLWTSASSPSSAIDHMATQPVTTSADKDGRWRCTRRSPRWPPSGREDDGHHDDLRRQG